MTRLPARLYSDLIGKPFAEGARGPEAYDCVGLAIALQRRMGRDVPDFASTLDELHQNYAEGGGLLGPAICIPRPVAGCVVLLRMLADERHLGVMLDEFRMIHTSRETGGVVIERILAGPWQRRVLGYYEVVA